MSTIVLGAGAVGCFLGGLIASRGEQVTLLGRPAVLNPLGRDGLRIQALGKKPVALPADAYRTTEDPAELGLHKRILVTVKATATESVAETIRLYSHPDATIISFQNGVRNTHKLRSWLSNIVLAGMVPFNVTQSEPGLFRQTTAGHLYLQDGTPSGAALADVFKRAGFPTELRSDMERVLWSKLVLNLNNAVNALAGIPLKSMLMDKDYRWVLAKAQQEALTLMTASGFLTCRIGRLLPHSLPYLLRLPTLLFKTVAGAALEIDQGASSSMQEDLRNGRLTEIDLFNGEIVRLAEKLKTTAPVNAALRLLIQQAETEGRLYRSYSGASLRQAIQAALQYQVAGN
jgi:2-dehydropantoate 2-reductase